MASHRGEAARGLGTWTRVLATQPWPWLCEVYQLELETKAREVFTITKKVLVLVSAFMFKNLLEAFYVICLGFVFSSSSNTAALYRDT